MISLILTIAFVGVVVWAITTLIPMPDTFKKAIWIVAAICIAFYVLAAFGLIGKVHDVPVPKLNG